MVQMKTTALLGAFLLRSVYAADVFAHFMVQNTFAYDVAEWTSDMETAASIGIDGFSLNWIPPDCTTDMDWTVDQIDNAYTAAEATSFKLIQSFDMSWSTCDTFWNVTFMTSILSQYATSSAAYKWNDDLLVSTYGGDTVDEYGNDFFDDLKEAMVAAGNTISLAPALTSFSYDAQTDADSAANDMVTEYTAADGFLNWQAWPLDVAENLTVVPDLAFQSALDSEGRTGPYIMAVSPWQYKDLDNGDSMDAWVEYSDHLFPHRFNSFVNWQHINPDIIEILTWNDFTESHYIRKLPSTDESAADFIMLDPEDEYTWGIDHSAWQVMAQYYISWWKNGEAPTVTEDQVVYWYRIHPKAAVCSGGGAIRNSALPEDALFAWALTKSAATVSITIGSSEGTFESVGGSPSVGMVSFPSELSSEGDTPVVSIIRDGTTVNSSDGSVAITSSCAWANFNPVVGITGPV